MCYKYKSRALEKSANFLQFFRIAFLEYEFKNPTIIF